MNVDKSKIIFQNINLLKMLNALLDTKSITKSGEILGISQPAASRIMAKLRYALNDPLLIRTSKGYILTPLAISLEKDVKDAIYAIHNVFKDRVFNPNSKKLIRIVTTDYGMLAVLSPFIHNIEKKFPNIDVEILPWRNEAFKQLENGSADLALYADIDIPLDFHYKYLFNEAYVIIAKKNHPINETSELKQFIEEVSKYNQIAATYPTKNGNKTDDVLLRMTGIKSKIKLSSPYFNSAPLIVANSSMIMFIPQKIAQYFAKILPIKIIKIPTQKANFNYRLIWHERAHKDEQTHWVKKLIIENFKN